MISQHKQSQTIINRIYSNKLHVLYKHSQTFMKTVSSPTKCDQYIGLWEVAIKSYGTMYQKKGLKIIISFAINCLIVGNVNEGKDDK